MDIDDIKKLFVQSTDNTKLAYILSLEKQERFEAFKLYMQQYRSSEQTYGSPSGKGLFFRWYNPNIPPEIMKERLMLGELMDGANEDSQIIKELLELITPPQQESTELTVEQVKQDKELLELITPPQQETPEQGTPSPESKAAIPPVINYLIENGYLNPKPTVEGKYLTMGDKKDGEIITFVFNYSGLENNLTYELYLKYIQTNNSPETIRRYIGRARNETN